MKPNPYKTAIDQRKQTPQEPDQSSSTRPIDTIQHRPEDTRPLNENHVKTLAESIAILGLIEPLVTDSSGRLLAGGHRLAAIHHLKEFQPDSYKLNFPDDLIPVRALGFDADTEPELALQIEIAENEQRRDYTQTEVKAIAQRLKDAGYIEVQGRPRKGEKPLMPAIAVVIGKHLRTVQRYLNEETEKPTEKSTTSAALLKPALQRLKKWQQVKPKTQKEKALAAKMPEIIQAIEAALDE